MLEYSCGGFMSSKIKIIIAGFFLIILNVLMIIYFMAPKIEMELKGAKNVTIPIGEQYSESGANADLIGLFSTKKLKVDITGKVNNNELGKYVITYTASNKSMEKEMIRVVNVVDNQKPVITLEKEVKGCKKNNLIDFKVKAVDDYDGDITDTIKYKIEENKVIFIATDSSKNITEFVQKIKYIDNEFPKISLKGEETINILKGEKYTELGAKAHDSCDGDISSRIKISHDIDTNNPDTYEVVYSVKDGNGNETKIRRYVNVIESFEKEEELEMVTDGTIYLTFDDGPGPYTSELLDVLDEYEVKATFFVTGQFPNYQKYIGEEYRRGHTVGIHTYTHKWTIYKSVESYLNDFNKIEEIILSETGVKPKIFRFPGGSSNTISRKYCLGIMSELAKKMEEQGYIYFDWHIDSGDTSKKNNSVNDIIKNMKKSLKGNGDYIVLMHDIKKNTIKALPEIIKYAKARGYKFEKITENTPVKHSKIAN